MGAGAEVRITGLLTTHTTSKGIKKNGIKAVSVGMRISPSQNSKDVLVHKDETVMVFKSSCGTESKPTFPPGTEGRGGWRAASNIE